LKKEGEDLQKDKKIKTMINGTLDNIKHRGIEGFKKIVREEEKKEESEN
jgi:hypothetical protein